MALLGTAQRSGQRRQVLAEIIRCITRRGVYADSAEELLPWSRDWRTIALTIVASLITLIRPTLGGLFTDGAVSRYALAPQGWRQLRDAAPSPASVQPQLEPKMRSLKP